MKKNPVKRMADYEFVWHVKNVIMTESKGNNLLCFTTPLNSGHGDYITNISRSVLQLLTSDVCFARGTEKKDKQLNRISYQYDLEIHNVIQEDILSASTHASYSFHGDQQKATTYRDLISELVYSIVDETGCDIF